MVEIALVVSQVIIGLGVIVALVRRPRVVSIVATPREMQADGVKEYVANTVPHAHSYDTLKNDGLGWRCSICGDPKGN